jgi:hypothetical protein
VKACELIAFFLLANQPIFGQIIADKTCTNLDQIPPYWINKVKAMVLVHTGQSHGRQVPYGLADLAALNAGFSVTISDGPAGPPSDGLRVSHEGC